MIIKPPKLSLFVTLLCTTFATSILHGADIFYDPVKAQEPSSGQDQYRLDAQKHLTTLKQMQEKHELSKKLSKNFTSARTPAQQKEFAEKLVFTDHKTTYSSQDVEQARQARLRELKKNHDTLQAYDFDRTRQQEYQAMQENINNATKLLLKNLGQVLKNLGQDRRVSFPTTSPDIIEQCNQLRATTDPETQYQLACKMFGLSANRELTAQDIETIQAQTVSLLGQLPNSQSHEPIQQEIYQSNIAVIAKAEQILTARIAQNIRTHQAEVTPQESGSFSRTDSTRTQPALQRSDSTASINTNLGIIERSSSTDSVDTQTGMQREDTQPGNIGDDQAEQRDQGRTESSADLAKKTEFITPERKAELTAQLAQARAEVSAAQSVFDQDQRSINDQLDLYVTFMPTEINTQKSSFAQIESKATDFRNSNSKETARKLLDFNNLRKEKNTQSFIEDQAKAQIKKLQQTLHWLQIYDPTSYEEYKAKVIATMKDINDAAKYLIQDPKVIDKSPFTPIGSQFPLDYLTISTQLATFRNASTPEAKIQAAKQLLLENPNDPDQMTRKNIELRKQAILKKANLQFTSQSWTLQETTLDQAAQLLFLESAKSRVADLTEKLANASVKIDVQPKPANAANFADIQKSQKTSQLAPAPQREQDNAAGDLEDQDSNDTNVSTTQQPLSETEQNLQTLGLSNPNATQQDIWQATKTKLAGTSDLEEQAKIKNAAFQLLTKMSIRTNTEIIRTLTFNIERYNDAQTQDNQELQAGSLLNIKYSDLNDVEKGTNLAPSVAKQRIQDVIKATDEKTALLLQNANQFANAESFFDALDTIQKAKRTLIDKLTPKETTFTSVKNSFMRFWTKKWNMPSWWDITTWSRTHTAESLDLTIQQAFSGDSNAQEELQKLTAQDLANFSKQDKEKILTALKNAKDAAVKAPDQQRYESWVKIDKDYAATKWELEQQKIEQQYQALANKVVVSQIDLSKFLASLDFSKFQKIVNIAGTNHVFPLMPNEVKKQFNQQFGAFLTQNTLSPAFDGQLNSPEFIDTFNTTFQAYYTDLAKEFKKSQNAADKPKKQQLSRELLGIAPDADLNQINIKQRANNIKDFIKNQYSSLTGYISMGHDQNPIQITGYWGQIDMAALVLQQA